MQDVQVEFKASPTDKGSQFLNRGMRYIVVGAWNTLFGLLLYTCLIWYFGPKHYLLICIPSNIIAITNAYICHKVFVFKTKGNYLKEYLRFYVVYGVSMLLGMVGMKILVDFIGISPIIANLILTCVTIVISFIGHHSFSFKPNSK